ncbi:MAG: RNA polymerase factor sigma-32 [Rhodothalassiaceae bacterium]
MLASDRDPCRADLIKTAMAAPMLEKETELELARRWRDDRHEPSLRRLITSYMRLVISVAGRYRHYGLPLSDLVQEGMVGLMEAAARFEPDREIRFSTYASWWIRSSMQDFILRNWSIVRTGTTAAHKSLFFNLRRLRAKIAEDPDRPMSRDSRGEVARTLGVRVRDVEVMEARLAANDRSLNTQIADGSDSEWQDFLPCQAPLPEDTVMAVHDRQTCSGLIAEALKSLTEREMVIIKARRLCEDDPKTLAELGQQLGISKERVRQIECDALAKLRSALIAKVPDPVAAGLTSRQA